MMDQTLVTMVIEDHAFQRHHLVRMLRSFFNGVIIEAEHGQHAVDLLDTAGAVDIIICDLDMPEMDGIEFMRHLAQKDLAPSVIISSALESSLLSSVSKMAKENGIRLLGVIEKPIRLELLRSLLCKHTTVVPKPVGTPAQSFSLDEVLAGISHHQFEPFFQPKVALQDGRLLGAEALARWRHPVHGVVAPYAFIPLLEQHAKIDELTMLMLEQSAQACHQWHLQGHDLSVAVNLSLVSLNNTGLVEDILNILKRADLSPRHMILEITETSAMTEAAAALEILTRLRMRGFGLSIDDYGTGFSSLKQLTRLPFTELKIDQIFVTGCASVPSNQAIIESSVGMASHLNLKTVAEGIETEADWAFLQTTACDIAQGYFIAKPMDGASFMAFAEAKLASQRLH